MPNFFRITLCVCLGYLACSLPATAQTGAPESAPSVSLSSLFPGAVMRSASHQVEDDPIVRGNHFEIDVESDFGTYKVGSIPMLLTRVHEIRTLTQAIDNFQRNNQQLAVKLRGQLQVGADSFVQILGSPFRTSRQLANQFGDNVDQTFSELNRRGPRSGDASRLPPQQISASDPILASHKRSIANQLDLDVYSTNPRVQSFLDEVAFARSHGNATAGTLSVGLGRPVRQPVAGGSVDAAIRSAVARNTPNELRIRNAGQLGRLGIGDPLIDALLSHPSYTPRHQTELAEHLAYLAGINNPGALLQAAVNARNETDAASYVETARLFATYHDRRRPLTGLLAASHLVVGQATDSTMVVFLPFDVLFWNESTASVFSAMREHAQRAGYATSEVVLTGIATNTVKSELENLGFVVLERFGLNG